MSENGVEISVETLELICRKFPSIALKPIGMISQMDIRTILMIEYGVSCDNLLF